jgi:HEPN domain-containing protein
VNTEDMALSLFIDAEYSLKEAENALQTKSYHRAVRRAQETVELCLKSALRLLGVEYPKKHDVSAALKRAIIGKHIPQWFTESIPRFALVSKRLAEDRGPSFYGDETLAKPPASLYSEKDAESAIEDARSVAEATKKLMDWWKKRDA